MARTRESLALCESVSARSGAEQTSLKRTSERLGGNKPSVASCHIVIDRERAWRSFIEASLVRGASVRRRDLTLLWRAIQATRTWRAKCLIMSGGSAICKWLILCAFRPMIMNVSYRGNSIFRFEDKGHLHWGYYWVEQLTRRYRSVAFSGETWLSAIRRHGRCTDDNVYTCVHVNCVSVHDVWIFQHRIAQPARTRGFNESNVDPAAFFCFISVRKVRFTRERYGRRKRTFFSDIIFFRDMVFRWRIRQRSVSRKGTAARSRAFGRARYLPQRKNIEPGARRAIIGTASEVPCPPLRSPSRVRRIDSTRASWHASCRQEQMFLPLGQRGPNVPRHATCALSLSLAPRVCFSLYPEGFSRGLPASEALLVQIYELRTGASARVRLAL